MRIVARVLAPCVVSVILVGAVESASQTFSLVTGSPTVLPPHPGMCGPPFSPDGDLYFPSMMVAPFGPAGCGLGWAGPLPPAPNNLDAFASGLGPPVVFPIPSGGASFFFSVDGLSTGDAGGCVPATPGAFPPDVGSEAGLSPFSSDAPADVFATCGPCPFPPLPAIAPGTMPHFQVYDGDGAAAPPYFAPPAPPIGPLAEPFPPGDGLDAFDGAPFGAWDFLPPGGDGTPDVPVYFSAGGPTAAGIGASGADVFVTVGGGPPAVYAPALALGLDGGGLGTDDVDALYVYDGDGLPFGFAPGPDVVLFSVTPASAIVGTLDACFGFPIGPDDILTPGAPFGAPGMICVVAAGVNFFLWDAPSCGINPLTGGADDNLDALDLAPPLGPPGTPVPTATATPTPTATATMTAAATPIQTCTPPPAPPGPTATPANPKTGLKCQREIARQASKLVAVQNKALVKCETSIVAGSFAGPCPSAAAITAIGKASIKFHAAIDKRCGGADLVCGGSLVDEETPAALGWPATCPDFEGVGCTNTITDCGDIATCIECIASAAGDQAISLYYGSLVLPSASPALNACQRTIGKAVSKFLVTKEKTIEKCWVGRINLKHSDDCPDASAAVGSPGQTAAAKIAKAELKKIKLICKACGGPDLLCDQTVTALDGTVIGGSGNSDDFTPTAIGFPASCSAVKIPGGGAFCAGSVTTLAELVECVDCVTEFKVDCIDRARVPEFGTYPCECNP